MPSGSRDQAHRRAGNRRLDRHAGVHQRERRAARRGHRRRAVRGHALADEADDVRELVVARQHGHERALGEVAVADVAPAGAAHRLVLAGAVRREVVVVDVALLGLRADRVDPLDVRGRAEGRDGQGLGLAAGEQAGAVGARHEPDLDRDRPDVVEAAAVDADALVEDEPADGLLLDQVEQALATRARRGERPRAARRCRRRSSGREPHRRSRSLQLRDPARQVVREPQQEVRGGLRRPAGRGGSSLSSIPKNRARSPSLYDSAPG